MEKEIKNNEMELLTFVIDESCYAVDIKEVIEITTYQKITSIPRTHPAIKGVIMQRENLVTIVDLKNILHNKNENNEKSLFIVTRINNSNIGFMIDKVGGLQKINPSNVLDTSEYISERNNIVMGSFESNGNVISVLDLQEITKLLTK